MDRRTPTTPSSRLILNTFPSVDVGGPGVPLRGNFRANSQSSPMERQPVSGTIGRKSGFLAYLDRRFKVTERQSDIQTELRAGLILYATMCYIIVVNPEVLYAAGMDKQRTASATAFCGMVCSALFCFIANLPFGAAPGMGLNTLFAYELIKGNHLTQEQALASCFASGCVFLVFGMTSASTAVISQIPLSLKKSVVVGIGLLQAIVGLDAMGLIRPGKVTILEAAPARDLFQALGLFTLALTALLILLEVPGSILIGIVGSTFLSAYFGMSKVPKQLFSLPSLQIATLDFSVFSTSTGCFLTFLMFLVLFIDTGGVVVGVAAQGDTLVDENGECINSTRAYVCLGIGIIVSSCFGTSPVVICLESAAAVNQGGRTGIVAFVASVLMGISAFLVPLIGMVPPSSTHPIMILVGSFMMGAVLAIRWDKVNHSLPAFLTITMTTFTCSIAHGVVYGYSLFILLNCPFWLARITRWQWLINRLDVEEQEGPTVLEKRTYFERQLAMRTESLFLPQHDTTETMSTTDHRSPSRRGTVGWL